MSLANRFCALQFHREGMLIAMIVHPPAFGLKLKSLDDSDARNMPGIKDVFIEAYPADFERDWCNVSAFSGACGS